MHRRMHARACAHAHVRMHIQVTLGGDYSEREEPGKGLVKSGKGVSE